MATLLTPVDVGGPYGKLVGQLVLMATVSAAYGVVLLVLTRAIGWERARRLVRHPRMVPLVAVVAYPGLSFESARLAYGHGDAAWHEHAVGAAGLVGCTAGLLSFYGLTHAWLRREAVGGTAVDFPAEARAAVPWVLRWPLAPRSFWPEAVLLSGRCVYVPLRPERVRLAVGHALTRILLVSVVCAVRPRGAGWCEGILGTAAAVCALHACFVTGTLCYRVPAVVPVEGAHPPQGSSVGAGGATSPASFSPPLSPRDAKYAPAEAAEQGRSPLTEDFSVGVCLSPNADGPLSVILDAGAMFVNLSSATFTAGHRHDRESPHSAPLNVVELSHNTLHNPHGALSPPTTDIDAPK